MGGEGTPSPQAALRWRSGWASTLVAGLELARRGEVMLAQDAPFSAVHVVMAAAAMEFKTGSDMSEQAPSA